MFCTPLLTQRLPSHVNPRNPKQEFRLHRDLRAHTDEYSPRGHGESGSGCRRARPTPPTSNSKDEERTTRARGRGSRLPNLHAASYTPQKEKPPKQMENRTSSDFPT